MTMAKQAEPLAGLAVGTPRTPLLPGADEVFRGIYTRAGLGFGPEVLAVCSAISGEGKSTVSLGIAVTMAQDFPERRVLLVEADLQRPVLAKDFELEAAPGLIDCLIAGQSVTEACRPTHLPNFDLLPAGEPSRVPGRPLRSARMGLAVDEMRGLFDLV